MSSSGSISLRRGRQAIIAGEDFMVRLRDWAINQWGGIMFPRNAGRVVLILNVLFVMGCMGFGSADPNETTEITYQEHVQPLLEAKCLDCHGDPPIGGSITISDEAAAIAHAPRIHARSVIMGDMPPGAPLSYQEKLILDTWIRAVVSLDDGQGGAGGMNTGGNAAGSAGSGGESGMAGAEAGTAGMLEPDEVDWVTYVGPLFAESCVACHGENSPQSGLDLTTFEGLETGGLQGTLLDTVNVESALLIDYLRGRNNRLVMPPSGALPEGDIVLVETWLMNGAPKGGDE